MRICKYLVEGNDLFDYEQKFNEDKQYEELRPTARVWRIYCEKCAAFDIEMVEGWRDGGTDRTFCWLFGHYVRRTDVAEPSSRLRSGHSSAPF
ncbi:hypothetical protein EV421DRAFT_1439387 [Armillaria borealis]|uniref:Uncharacterized protein n=1 Tax=Armillaria borealis TaxID=47425 RepID=A0AA39J123_9AGAR|nr:hypothetical protein EV421DRAFT_1439387 [Armillaria borealis]